MVSYHYAGVDQSTDRADKHHQLGVEYRVPVRALVVSKVVTDDTNDDTVKNEQKEPDDHMDINLNLWDHHIFIRDQIDSRHYFSISLSPTISPET